MTQENRYSAEALGKFLDFVSEKGLIKKSTATSRKTAAIQILSVLDEADKSDLRKINVDETFNRFQNRSGSKFKPDSLSIYKSRFSLALKDFLRWVENPAAFRPSVVVRSTKSDTDDAGQQRNRGASPGRQTGFSRRGNANEGSGLIFPIPIRSDVVVELVNIPNDLTKEEASKIAAVIQALAVPDK